MGPFRTIEREPLRRSTVTERGCSTAVVPEPKQTRRHHPSVEQGASQTHRQAASLLLDKAIRRTISWSPQPTRGFSGAPCESAYCLLWTMRETPRTTRSSPIGCGDCPCHLPARRRHRLPANRTRHRDPGRAAGLQRRPRRVRPTGQHPMLALTLPEGVAKGTVSTRVGIRSQPRRDIHRCHKPTVRRFCSGTSAWTHDTAV